MVMITGCVYDGARTTAEYAALGIQPRDEDLTSGDLLTIRPSLANRNVYLEHDMNRRVGRVVSASIDKDASGAARRLNVTINLDSGDRSMDVMMKQVIASKKYLSLRHILYTKDVDGKTVSRLGSVGIEVSLVTHPGRNFTAHRLASDSDMKALSVCAGLDGGVDPTHVAMVEVTNDAFAFAPVSTTSGQQGMQRYKTSQFALCTTRLTPLVSNQHTHTHLLCPLQRRPTCRRRRVVALLLPPLLRPRRSPSRLKTRRRRR